MSRCLVGHDEVVARWIGDKLGKVICPPYTAIGWLDREGTLKAAAVFNNWNGSNLEVTIYGPGAMTRSMLRTGFSYAFVQQSANRLTAYTERSNDRMQKILRNLGFTYEATHKKWFGPLRENDGIVFYITPSQAMKWIA